MLIWDKTEYFKLLKVYTFNRPSPLLGISGLDASIVLFTHTVLIRISYTDNVKKNQQVCMLFLPIYEICEICNSLEEFEQ